MTTETPPSGAASMSGLFGSEAANDPYPVYERLRRNAPVTRLGDMGFWAVAKYEDVTRILGDHETFSSIVGARAMAGEAPQGMLFNDPPMHDRLRGLIAKAFTPRIIQHQRPAIQAYCDELIEKLLAHPEETDLVAHLAYPLPVMVIANMLGVGDGDMATFKRWSDNIIENIGPALLMGDDSGMAEMGAEFDAYFTERLEKLRREPEENLLSELVHVETEDGRLTVDELLMFCRTLLVAGNETTTGLIVNSIRAFSEFPAALKQVREDMSLLPTAIEEVLRYYAPFQATIRRATKDVELRGQTIGKDERVLVLLASANRDADQFDRPNEFDVTRMANKHISFGMGIHACIGSPLARLEGDVALGTLLPRIESVAVLESAGAQMLRPGGPKSLRVRFGVG